MIKVNNLNFSYKSAELDVQIFKNFNLQVNSGDFVAIKGPSGSGKSTLLYLIAGLLNFQSGNVFIENQDISQLNDLELSSIRSKKVAFIFQQFHLLPKINVLENILLPTIYPIELNPDQKGKTQTAREIAKFLGIDDRLEHMPNQLSGGQQQRVAIARALINNADIILADEPTGNLDSESSKNIINILKDLNKQGRTIVLITHDEEVAQAASTVYNLRDGQLILDERHTLNTEATSSSTPTLRTKEYSYLSYFNLLPYVLKSILNNKTRSLLTMLGIIVGVAALCSMLTLGSYTKERVIANYTELGVNTIKLSGNQNWDLKATDIFPLKYRYLDWENELLPLKNIFPMIQFISPNLTNWRMKVTYAGKSIENDPRLIGISEDGLKILGRKLLAGKNMSYFHVERKQSVCIVGFDIAKRLFTNNSAIGKIIHLTQDKSVSTCKVIGVLESKSSNKEWSKPNYQIFVPFTYFQSTSEHWWYSQIKDVTIQIKPGYDIEKVGIAIKTFFEGKYGVSARFRIDSDSVLISQMNKFLTLFSLLLAAVALVTLAVGGIGITNMMLVSVSERLMEIGLRKSLGATHKSIKYQFLIESIIICFIAGLIGIIAGVITYSTIIYAASKLIPKLEFEWVFNYYAIFISIIAILIVGIFSGLIPALKAQKLQVIEALRSE